MKVQAQILAPEAPQGSLRIAFASTDDVKVTDHFGKGLVFFLYDVFAEGWKKAGKIVFTPEDGDQKEHGDKSLAKVDALKTCHIVYSAAIGGPVAARLTQNKIQPLVIKEEDGIEGLLTKFKEMLTGNTPPWISKILGQADPNRFDAFDDDEDE